MEAKESRFLCVLVGIGGRSALRFLGRTDPETLILMVLSASSGEKGLIEDECPEAGLAFIMGEFNGDDSGEVEGVTVWVEPRLTTT